MRAATLTYRPFAGLTMPKVTRNTSGQTETVERTDRGTVKTTVVTPVPPVKVEQAKYKLTCRHIMTVNYIGDPGVDNLGRFECEQCPRLKSGKKATRGLRERIS